MQKINLKIRIWIKRLLWGFLFFLFIFTPFSTLQAVQIDATFTGAVNTSYNTATNWDIGVVPNNGVDTYRVFINGFDAASFAATLDTSATIDTLTISATPGGDHSLSFNNSRVLTMNGGITLNSTFLVDPPTEVARSSITLNSTGTTTEIVFNSQTAGNDIFTISTNGGGLSTSGITLGALSNLNRIRTSSSLDTLVNQVVIQGRGNLGANSTILSNEKTVNANVSGQTLTVDTVGASTNTGTMKATGGGIFDISGSTITNTGGLIQIEAGSTGKITSSTVTGGNVTLVSNGTLELNGGTISGATLTNTSTGVIKTTGGTSKIGGTITNPLGGSILIQPLHILEFEVGGTLTNNGEILVSDAAASTATMRVEGAGTLTLGGTGLLTLGGTEGLGVVSADAQAIDRVLSNSANHTIQGSGFLGNNILGVINNAGTILANSNGKTLTLDTFSTSTNTGTMKALSGGLFNINSTTLTNTGGLIQIEAGSTGKITSSTVTGGNVTLVSNGILELSNGDISGATVTNTSTGVIKTTGGTSLIGNTITNPLGGSILIQPGHTLGFEVGGTLTNNGEILVSDAAASTATMRVEGAGTLTLGGTGLLTLGGTEGLGVVSADAQSSTRVLSNSANHTIQGSGTLGNNILGVINNAGTILANTNGKTLTLDTFSTSTNTATMKALSGGILNISGTTLTNTGGLFQIEAGSTGKITSSTVTGGNVTLVSNGILELSNGDISGATVTNTSTGVIKTTGGTSLIGNTITNPLGGSILIQPGHTLGFEVGGTLTNNGEILVSDAAAGTASMRVEGAGTLTLDGSGFLTLGGIEGLGTVSADVQASTRVLTNSANHTIRGSGALGNNIVGTINNAGTIDANSTGKTLTIDPFTSFSNTGTAKASNGGTLTLTAGTYTNTGTIKAVGAGSTVNVNNNVSGANGAWVADGGTINLNSGVDVSTTGDITITNDGLLNLVAHASNATITGAKLSLLKGATGTGLDSRLSVNSEITLTGDYTFDITDEADMTWGAGSILRMNGGVGLTNQQVSSWPKQEVGGTDLGTDAVNHVGAPAGFASNFDLTKLVIGANAHVSLVDSFNNGNRGGTGGNAEALYVDTLEFVDVNGRLNLSGLHLYYTTLTGDASQILQNLLNTLIVNNTGTGNHVNINDNVVVAFDNVTGDGDTSKTASTQGNIDSFLANPIVGRLINETFYNISTTATFDVTSGKGFLVKLPYLQADFDNDIGAFGFIEDQLRALHKTGGGIIEDITATPAILTRFGIAGNVVDTTNNFVYGFTTSFSDFGVGVNPEPATLILLGSALLGLFPWRKRWFGQ